MKIYFTYTLIDNNTSLHKLLIFTLIGINGKVTAYMQVIPFDDSRLAGKYRWREFPVVITGNYRPGKYSIFWQSGKYWEIQNFRAVLAKLCCNISINLS